jgi:hypothetical protein
MNRAITKLLTYIFVFLSSFLSAQDYSKDVKINKVEVNLLLEECWLIDLQNQFF